MHTLLDHDGDIPAFASVTEARTHESCMVNALALLKGSIVVFDKGYFSYSWFRRSAKRAFFFVTRLKQNAVFRLLERRPVNRKTGVTSDHIIEVTNKSKPLRLRRVGYRDPERGKHNEFLTNPFRPAPKTIADIYKDRGQIEIFFREITQNLRIRASAGNTKNAVRIQIYTTLTVYPLFAYQKFLNRICMSVQQIFQISNTICLEALL